MFESPNLDCLTTDPAEMRAASRVLRLLARYAHLKSVAMRHREMGRIDDARRVESAMDRIYDNLPDWARW